MDRIVSAGLSGLNRLDWIVSYCIGWMSKHRLLCIVWLLLGCYGWGGWTGWGVGETGVGRTVVRARRNRSTGTGAPPLALEGLWCAGWLLRTWGGWDGWTGWGVGRMGLGIQMLAPTVTGAPPWSPEQERHCWLLRGGALCEVVASTNCVGAARTRSICVREAK